MLDLNKLLVQQKQREVMLCFQKSQFNSIWSRNAIFKFLKNLSIARIRCIQWRLNMITSVPDSGCLTSVRPAPLCCKKTHFYSVLSGEPRTSLLALITGIKSLKKEGKKTTPPLRCYSDRKGEG